MAKAIVQFSKKIRAKQQHGTIMPAADMIAIVSACLAAGTVAEVDGGMVEFILGATTLARLEQAGYDTAAISRHVGTILTAQAIGITPGVTVKRGGFGKILSAFEVVGLHKASPQGADKAIATRCSGTDLFDFDVSHAAWSEVPEPPTRRPTGPTSSHQPAAN